MNIINVETCHLDKILEIENESFSCPWSKQSFVDALNNKNITLLVAIDEEKTVCGFVCVLIIDFEAEILDIAVKKSMRKKGIAGMLFSYLSTTEQMKNVEKIFLEVRESNHPARSFYEKQGFVPIGVRHNYYRNPTEDAVLMGKDLHE